MRPGRSLTCTDSYYSSKENFAADRAVGDQIIASMPAVQVGVCAQRDVLGRAVRYLVGEAVIRQLLDIGSGLPTAENVHEIAQRIDPETSVVYLDNAPVVVSHAQAILAYDKVTFAAEGDLRDPAPSWPARPCARIWTGTSQSGCLPASVARPRGA
jgi:hypothetical protein